MKLQQCLGLIVSLLLISLAFSCSFEAEKLERQDLFSLQYGKLEHQVDIFQVDNYQAQGKNRVSMRNGRIIIVNGNAGKVMEFSSWGDILGLYYNPEKNPRPSMLSNERDITGAGSSATPYAFQAPGEIAFSHDGRMFIEDTSPDSRQVIDTAQGTYLNSVILRFDVKRQLKDYLGQEGPLGTPFPMIDHLQVIARDQLVVTCRTRKGWLAFWFEESGKRRYALEIDAGKVPIPETGTWQAVVRNVFSDPELPICYVHIDYYSTTFGSASSVASRMYRVDLISGKWDSYVSIPILTIKSIQGPAVEAFYQSLGMNQAGLFFFLTRVAKDRYELITMDRNGRTNSRKSLNIPLAKSIDFDLHLSAEGILSAYCLNDDGAMLYWWRTDGIAQAVSGP